MTEQKPDYEPSPRPDSHWWWVLLALIVIGLGAYKIAALATEMPNELEKYTTE